jgi:hypothetical protein
LKKKNGKAMSENAKRPAGEGDEDEESASGVQRDFQALCAELNMDQVPQTLDS